MSEPFDFEAFVAGTQLARRTVYVYRVDNRDEILRLQADHDRLPDASGDEREATENPRRALAARIAALREEMEASRQGFVIRTITPDELATIQSDDTDVYDQLAIQSVEPKLTAEQWRRVADVVGLAQWSVLVADANDLIRSKVAVPDFSPSVSMTLSPRASSQN